MNKDTNKEELWKRRFVLATFAQSNDIANTKSFAEGMGIKFDKLKVLSDVESLFGNDTANALRGWWDEERQAKFDEKLESLLNQAVKELISEQANARDPTQQPTPAPIAAATDLARGTIVTLTRSIRELLNPVNPMHWSSQGLGLIGANRGGSSKATQDGPARPPEIAPSVSIEHDVLIIWLRLRSNDLIFPETSDAISLFIYGEQFTDFAFHRESNDSVALEVKMSNQHFFDVDKNTLVIRYKPDLGEISVFSGKLCR